MGWNYQIKTTNSSWVVSFKRKTRILYPDEGFFTLHSTATERKKDKIWVQKTVLQQIIISQDEFDRHVLAAAIKTNANVIVTNNLKDFPKEYLASFGLTAKSADDFLTDIIDLNPEEAVKAFRELVLNRRNPDLDEYAILDIFRNQRLVDTANYLHSQL